MSLPPVTVHIKRKRTDDPVDFLRVQESSSKSKRRLTDFIFSRQVEPLNESTSTSSPVVQQDQARRIKPLPRSASSQFHGAQTPSKPQIQETAVERSQAAQPTAANNTLQSSSQDTITTTPRFKTQQPRRFHLSRSASTTPSAPSVISGRVQKPPALFVERRTRARLSPTGTSSPFTPAITPESEQVPALKKPGQAARIAAVAANSIPTSRSSQPAPGPQDVRLPSGLIAPWSLDDKQLVEEMQRYTLQEIGYSIAEAAATEPGRSPGPTSAKKPSKFKPKVPKLRYHERHPEEFADQDNDTEVEDVIEDIGDDSDYIIDTYIRVPADDMELDTTAETNFGFLVLDGQQDIDEFYSVEIESDEDEDYDEDDENAENHYSADYPDEEVESDDEYGRNPYQYVNDDEAFSEDSENGIKYPWTKKPAWLRKAEHGSDEEVD